MEVIMVCKECRTEVQSAQLGPGTYDAVFICPNCQYVRKIKARELVPGWPKSRSTLPPVWPSSPIEPSQHEWMPWETSWRNQAVLHASYNSSKVQMFLVALAQRGALDEAEKFYSLVSVDPSNW